MAKKKRVRTTRQTSASTLADDPAWNRVAVGIHARLKQLYPKRYRKPDVFALGLKQMREAQFYKEFGCIDWEDYLARRWGANSRTIKWWEAAADLYARFPDAMALAPPGLVAIRRIAYFARHCETADDVLWWGRLSRVTSIKEFHRIVQAANDARRCGNLADASALLVGFVDGEAFETHIRPALEDARKATGCPGLPLGTALVWLAAKARGQAFPSRLGMDSGGLRTPPPTFGSARPRPRGGPACGPAR